MSISMSQISAPAFIRMLNNLRGLLEKAVAHAESEDIEPEVLVGARLYPNMLALANQVQIACDTAKRCIARLSGVDAPVNEDTEKTLQQLMARIDSTLEYIKSVSSDQLDGTEDKPVKLELPKLTLDFKGIDYLTGFALPNFYFHISTAHGILRKNGVKIGKMDYMGAP